MLTIDRREANLIQALSTIGVKHDLQDLPVGDILCRYVSGVQWIAERKQASDLTASLTSGRLSEQTARLHEAGYQLIFWLVEGSFHGQDIADESLWGACINMSLRSNSHFIRTLDVHETARVVKQLIRKCAEPPPGIPHGLQTPAPRSKRKRDAEKDVVFIRQLMCIPSVSEKIANILQKKFVTMPALQKALSDVDSFPQIELNSRCCIGKQRVRKLRKYLCE